MEFNIVLLVRSGNAVRIDESIEETAGRFSSQQLNDCPGSKLKFMAVCPGSTL